MYQLSVKQRIFVCFADAVFYEFRNFATFHKFLDVTRIFSDPEEFLEILQHYRTNIP